MKLVITRIQDVHIHNDKYRIHRSFSSLNDQVTFLNLGTSKIPKFGSTFSPSPIIMLGPSITRAKINNKYVKYDFS